MPQAVCFEVEFEKMEARIAAGLQKPGPPMPGTTYTKLPDGRCREVTIDIFGNVTKDKTYEVPR